MSVVVIKRMTISFLVGCSRQMDVCLIIDLTASKYGEYNMTVDFTLETIYNLDLSFDRVRVGVVTYQEIAKVQFHLDPFNAGGNTNTYGPLQACREQIFTKANGDRIGAPNKAILVSTGDTNIEPLETQKAAGQLRYAKAEIFVVGVGPKPRIGEIKGIASDPVNTHVFYMKDSSEVVGAADKLTDVLCQ